MRIVDATSREKSIPERNDGNSPVMIDSISNAGKMRQYLIRTCDNAIINKFGNLIKRKKESIIDQEAEEYGHFLCSRRTCSITSLAHPSPPLKGEM